MDENIKNSNLKDLTVGINFSKNLDADLDELKHVYSKNEKKNWKMT